MTYAIFSKRMFGADKLFRIYPTKKLLLQQEGTMDRLSRLNRYIVVYGDLGVPVATYDNMTVFIQMAE